MNTSHISIATAARVLSKTQANTGTYYKEMAEMSTQQANDSNSDSLDKGTLSLIPYYSFTKSLLS